MFQIFVGLAIAEIGFRIGPRLLAVVTVNGVDDLLFGRQHWRYFQAGKAAHRRLSFKIKRIGHCQLQAGFGQPNRQTARLSEEARRKPFSFGNGRRRPFDCHQR